MIKTWQGGRDIHEHLMGPISHTIRCELMQAEIDALRKALAQQVAAPATGELLSDGQIVDWMWGRDLNRLNEDQREQVFLLIRDVEAHHKIGAKP